MKALIYSALLLGLFICFPTPTIAGDDPENFIGPQPGTIHVWKNCIGANEILKVIRLEKKHKGMWRLASILRFPQNATTEGLNEVSYAVHYVYTKDKSIVLQSNSVETILLDLSRETWKTPVTIHSEPDFIPERVEATAQVTARTRKQYMGSLREFIDVTMQIDDKRLTKPWVIKHRFVSGIGMLRGESEQLVEIRELDPEELSEIEKQIAQTETAQHSP